jgi:hypothetical protein
VKNPNTKKLRAILIAAILGALLFDAPIWMTNFSNDEGFDLAVTIPIVFISQTLGFKQLVNPYIVGGLFGAIIFALIAIIWQFILKGGDRNKK